MTSFLHWRKMTWAIVLAGLLAIVWVIASAFSLFIILVCVGALGVLSVLWYLTEPLWRQGRGAQVKRRKAPVIAFKPVKSLVEARPGQNGR